VKDPVGTWALHALAAGEAVEFVARGRSMWPWLRDGDRLTLAPLQAAPRVGEVVAVRVELGLGPVHRVIYRRRDGSVLLKGDATFWPEGWMAADEVVGRLAAARRAGRPVRWGRLAPLAWSLGVAAARGLTGRYRTGHH
jgi:hypothetical protein